MAVRDIHPKGGEAYAHPLTFVDKATGLPLDASLWTFRAQVRPYPGGPLLESFAFNVTNAGAGIVVMSLTAAQTDALAAQFDEDHPAAYDLEVTREGSPWTYMEGAVLPDPDVTR